MATRLRLAPGWIGSVPDLSSHRPDDRRLYSPDDAAELFGIARKTVYVLVDQGKLGCYRVGRRIRFSWAHLDQYLKSVEQPAG